MTAALVDSIRSAKAALDRGHTDAECELVVLRSCLPADTETVHPFEIETLSSWARDISRETEYVLDSSAIAAEQYDTLFPKFSVPSVLAIPEQRTRALLLLAKLDMLAFRLDMCCQLAAKLAGYFDAVGGE